MCSQHNPGELYATGGFQSPETAAHKILVKLTQGWTTLCTTQKAYTTHTEKKYRFPLLIARVCVPEKLRLLNTKTHF